MPLCNFLLTIESGIFGRSGTLGALVSLEAFFAIVSAAALPLWASLLSTWALTHLIVTLTY